MSVRDSRAPYAELVSVPCSTTSTSSPFVSSDSHDFASVRQWLQSLLEIQLPTTDLAISLKDGVFLCTLMNKLEPGAIQDIQYDCNTEAWARNIERFLNAAQKAGLADSQVFCVPDLLDSRDIGKVAETLSSLRDLYDAVGYRYSRIPTEQEALHKRRYAVPEHENVYNNPRGKGLEQGCEIDGARRITLYDKDAFSQPMMDSGCILHSVQPGYRSNEEDDQLAWDDMQPQFLRQKNKRNTITLASSYSSWTDSTADLSIDSIRSQRSAFVTEDQTPVSPSSRIDVISCSSNNDSETDNEVRKQERRPHNHRISSPSIFNQNSNQPDRPEKAYSSTSRLTRLSHFSFRKKTPIRQKIPFHMRYQEWTDMTTQKEISKRSAAKETPFQNDVRYQSNDDTADCFNSIGQGRKSMMLSAQSPHPSASSPVCSMAAALHELSIREPLEEDSCATQKLQSNDASMYTSTDFDDQLAMDTINRRSLDLGIPGAVPRRKSTGTFELSCKNKLSSGDNGERLELLDERGAVIARYKLGNVIGKGQFGTVYRALNLKTGQIVAIKRINLDPSISSQIDDVMQEAQLLSSLSHRNIVRYEGFIREDSCINIVLEFVENGSLLNTLKAFGSFPESLVANYSHRILQGLAYLHDKDVVHCDLKAANILTTKLGDVKLSDFGVSMNLRLTDDPSDFVAGTPNWMAPEVIELKGACTKSDIWSLGCTVIELLTGKPPYSDLIAMTTLFRIVEDDHPPIPENISTYLNDFLLQCFQKEPKDRPSAQQLLQHPWITANILDDEHDDVTKQLESSIMRRPPSSSIPRSFQYVPPSIPEHCSEDQEPCQTREAGTRPPNRRSLLFDKFTERQVKTLSRTTLRNHCFVKGSFAKAAVNCKACRLPIKRNALVCRDCGLICHDKCKTTTSCTSAQEKDTDESIKQSNETQSIQDVQDISKDPIPTFEKAPRPMSSMSTQLRERTRKLSRVFAPGNNHQNRRPHSTRSYDTLRSMSQRHCSSVAEGKDIIQVPDLDKEICNSASAGYVEASSAQRGRKKGKRPSNTSDECVIS